MSILSTSLRESISAEKESLKQKQQLAKTIPEDTAYTLLDALKEKLASKSLPAGLYYEIMLLLLKANMINKQTEQLTKASATSVDIAKTYLDIPIQSVDRIASLNIDTLRKCIAETTQSIEDITAMRKPIGLLACLSQMAMHAVANNKNYYKGLAGSITQSQTQMGRVIQSQYTSAFQNVVNMMTGYGMFDSFRPGFAALPQPAAD